MENLDDTKLIALVQATGDGAAFKELVNRHSPALLSFLCAQGSDFSLAEEAAQRSFIKAYDKLFQFQGASTFRTWLFSIALRERLQLLRKQRSELKTQEALINSRDTHAAPDGDLALDVDKGLSTLTEHERNALLLCDLHDFTHREAAELLGVPLGSLKTYISRARQTMRVFLSKSV